MALVDDVKITIKAGNGGQGGKAFLSIPGSPKVYADGGDGGRGGNIYFQASNNVSDLSQFRFQKVIKGQDGEKGMNKNCTGKNGKDIFVLVPPGTKILDENTKEVFEILDKKPPVLTARGGRAGEGSHNYKPDINNFQLQHEEGGKGEEKKLHLVLKLIADIGLIGFPNAGKSSLLEKLTNANPKIGDYAFTTLEPNLGAMPVRHVLQGNSGGGKIIIADIPGLIEGASKGIGLGIQFLKHIEKTKILVHCIDSQEENPIKSYETVREEFREYSKSLLEKEEIILLTKIDLISEEKLKTQIKLLRKFKKKIMAISIYNEKSINELRITLKKFTLNTILDR
ncbi:Obg family GTPase CgtA [Candidatus Parcubacteria bacterium]|nr:MAG: Obg family GTPase CgtA [Candidatus Parcubacteria bacterium]